MSIRRPAIIVRRQDRDKYAERDTPYIRSNRRMTPEELQTAMEQVANKEPVTHVNLAQDPPEGS